ncbi:MAG TPA: polyketide synthase [Vicinamibacterales bacterium]|nr:polyketide synthase [Vicinamibacterales bacterium]
MSASLTDLTIDGCGIGTLTLRDANGKNALSVELVAELESRIDEVRARAELKVLVMTGTDDYFCTGANRAVLQAIVAGRVAPGDLLLPRRLLDIPVPVIAAMAGHAIGGGLALGICADITIAARESRYGATFMRYGFTPGMGMTSLLEHAMGPPLAHELLLTGATYRGTRFERHGAFTYVLPRSAVAAKAQAIAAELAARPRTPLVLLKAALSRRKRELFERARTHERVMHDATFGTAEVARLIEDLE